MNDTPLRRRLGLDPSSAAADSLEAGPESPLAEAPLRRRSDAEPEHASGGDGNWTPQPDATTQAQSRARIRGAVRELLETAIFILLVFFIVRGIVQNFEIEGSSMEPTMHNGQYILVNKLVYFHFDLNAPLRLLPGNETLPQRIVYPFTQPQRGDVIVFEYPRDISKDYIKRVIAVPGDTVEIRDQRVYINDQLLDEPYLQGAPTYCYGSDICTNNIFTVPDGTVFVMGDNRTNSSDSRDWGALSLERAIGQAWVVYYPFEDWGVVKHVTYDTVP